MDLIYYITKFFLGVYPSREDFEWYGLIPSILVICTTYFTIVNLNFLNVVDNMIELSMQPSYMGIIAKISFLLIPVRIISLSLFKKLDNMIGRYIAALITQLVGLVGGTILHYLLNGFIKSLTNISPMILTIYSLLPYVLTLIVILLMQYIYTKENFDLQEYLGSNK